MIGRQERVKEPAASTLINNSAKLTKIGELCDRILFESKNQHERVMAIQILDIIDGVE